MSREPQMDPTTWMAKEGRLTVKLPVRVRGLGLVLGLGLALGLGLGMIRIALEAGAERSGFSVEA